MTRSETLKAEAEVWMDRYAEEQEKIVSLSLDEARRKAELLLADPRKFECVVSVPPPNDMLAKMAPGLQSLFSRYESIHVVDDEAFLSREEIALFEWDGGQFWKIGHANGHYVTLVKAYEEPVYDVQDELGDPYPSIFHWLLMVSAIASNFGS